MSKKWIVIGLLLLGFGTRFLFFGHPNRVVFDEVHFGKFISAYSTHKYYFDIHPPLGKLMIAGFGKVFHVNPDFSFPEIGKEFPDNGYKALRFLPSLASSFLPLVIYLLALELGFSAMAAVTVGVLIGLDNGILSQTRYILLDAFLLLFGCLCLLSYFKYYNKHRRAHLVWAGIFGALAISIKWTGLTFLALPGLIELILAIRKQNLRSLVPGIVFLGLVPLVIYFSVFAVHFSLLTKTGDGDAFMSAEFQKTLEGSTYQTDETLETPTLVGKFTELNDEMYQSNKRLTATHPYSSQWYEWPIMKRPIFYWVHDQARIYFLGNPVIWWGSTVGVLAILLLASSIRNRKLVWILMGGYWLNLLPFMGIKRVMFLYHYLGALLFAIFMLMLFFEHIKAPRKAYIALCVLAAMAFAYFAPLTYGLNLSPKAYENHVWLKTWR